MVFITTLKMGDMVCMTPLFRAVKETYPRAEVTVCGDRVHKDLLEHSPHVDRVVVWNQRSWWTHVKELKKLRPSHAVVIDPNPRSLALMLSLGTRVMAPRIVGYSPYNTRMYRLLSFGATTRPLTIQAYVPREYLRLLEPLGISTSDTTKMLAHSKDATIRVGELLRNLPRPWVGYLPSAGNKVKCWPCERFRDVIQRVHEAHGGTALVLGGPHDQDIVEEVTTGMPSYVLPIHPDSLDMLKASISKLDMVVGVDTGPIYIAEAYGIPTVDIVGPVAEYVQPPQGVCNEVVLPRGEREPQLYILNSREGDENEIRRQLEATHADDVVAAINHLMATCVHI